MQLSKHFTLEEFTKSMTAQRKGIDNTPGSGDIKNLEDLCYEVLEPIRNHFDKPVTITSGYRSEALCEAIGSKKRANMQKGRRQTLRYMVYLILKLHTGYRIIVTLINLYLNIILLMILQKVGFIVRIMKRVIIESKY